MNNQVGTKELSDSNKAVRQYIKTISGCNGRHEATIIALTNGKEHYGMSYVYVNETHDNAEIIIEDLHKICNCDTNRFTADKDSFSLIVKTLKIKSESKLTGKIIIEITAK